MLRPNITFEWWFSPEKKCYACEIGSWPGMSGHECDFEPETWAYGYSPGPGIYIGLMWFTTDFIANVDPLMWSIVIQELGRRFTVTHTTPETSYH
jgi:hypothetical protein